MDGMQPNCNTKTLLGRTECNTKYLSLSRGSDSGRARSRGPGGFLPMTTCQGGGGAPFSFETAPLLSLPILFFQKIREPK
jgi:hypothetical protein